MKTARLLFPLIALVVMIASCQKEESDDRVASQKTQKSSFDLIDRNGNLVTLESLSFLYPVATSSSSNLLKSSGNISANGHYGGYGSVWTFSAMVNNSGVHGQSHVEGIYNFQMESAYLAVQDNMAVYGGEITQVTGSNFLPVAPGDYFYWGVKDNGEGSNAPPDQWAGYAFHSIGGPLFYDPSAFFFSLPPFLWIDVDNASDQIQVKN